MTEKIQIAFKEWACIVAAMGSGEQSIILRKGGIHERGGKFMPEHNTFVFFPTFEHQKREDLNERGRQWLNRVGSSEPAAGAEMGIAYSAEVKECFWIEAWDVLQRLESFHLWSTAAVQKKYSMAPQKGLYLLFLRVFKLPKVQIIKNFPEYGGCRSWVELKQTLDTENRQPVLSDDHFTALRKSFKEAGGLA